MQNIDLMDRCTEAGSEASPVTAYLVSEVRRGDCLPRQFGQSFIAVEAAIFGMMGALCHGYRGGYWHFYELSNRGFYMAPNTRDSLRLFVEGNGFEGTMSADAAGIVACLMAYSHLSFRLKSQTVAKEFHKLREYALGHPEAHLMFAAID